MRVRAVAAYKRPKRPNAAKSKMRMLHVIQFSLLPIADVPSLTD